MYLILDIKVIKQLNFKFSAAVAYVICRVLVLTRKVIGVNSDGNKMVRYYMIIIIICEAVPDN